MTTAAEAAAVKPAAVRGPRFGSLVGPFVRHLLVLVGVAAGVYVLAGAVGSAAQLGVWLGASLIMGLLAALVGRRSLGVLLVVAGFALGVLLHLHLRLGSGEAAMHELVEHGPLYAAAAGAAMLGYLAVSLVMSRQRRRPYADG